MSAKTTIKLGKIYKRKVRPPEYIIPTHEVYRAEGIYTKKYKYYDLNYGYFAGCPITEYDILTFYTLMEGGEWEK